MKTRRILAGILCLLMIIAACGCTATKKSGADLSGERSLTHKISDEPIELSFFAKDMDEYKGQMIWDKAFDMTNILITPTLSENVTDMDQALALAVAAKEIPDIVYDWKQENFNKYGTQGALIPLNDLIEEHAPNYKKFLDEHPDARYFSTAPDGNIYFIPFTQGGIASAGWFARQDWLDKLGLEAPNTVDEFYNVMVAMRDNDPNGNGQKDEVPYFGGKGDLEPLLCLFDAKDNFRYKDGKVTFGPLEDGFLPAIKEIAKWYKEGLIDKEFFTRSDARDYFCNNNTGGITSDWFGSTSLLNTTLADTIPGFKLVPFAPPEDVNGVRMVHERRTLYNGEGWAISSMNEHPVETIKFFDFWFTEEGRRLVNFGIEGIHHDMVDGAPVFKKEVVESDKGITTTMISVRSMANFGFWQDFAYEEQWTHPIGIEGAKMYIDNGYLPDPLEWPLMSYFDDAKEHNTLKTQIETLVDEAVQKWIMGVADPDAEYETFKKNLESLDVQKYIDIEQRAYDKFLAEVAQ